MQSEHSLAHCVTAYINFKRGLAWVVDKLLGKCKELMIHKAAMGGSM